MRGGGTRPSQAHPLLAPWGFVALPMPAWGRSGLTMAGQLRWGAHGRRARVVTGGHPGHRLCLLHPLRRGHGWSWRCHGRARAALHLLLRGHPAERVAFPLIFMFVSMLGTS